MPGPELESWCNTIKIFSGKAITKYEIRAMKKPEEESWGDAPAQNPLSKRAAAAFYYCVSSIAVQFMNKVSTIVYLLKLNAYWH